MALEKAHISFRELSVLVKWDYPYWQNLFRNAKDEELDGLYARFLKEAGITLGPLTVYDAKAHAVILPPLRKAKDVFLKQRILPRGDKKTMLIVAFWDAHFAFNMGFEGFTVDAIECYREAVKVAETARKTLPRPIADRFMFDYGLAEKLARAPTYDVIVSFCLEHVRDPKHVMAETLRHLNPDGCAYFTPPIGHGCDSPSHLQYFQEEDLRDLLPEGFTAVIHRVKFQASSPYPNCFVMEVRRAG